MLDSSNLTAVQHDYVKQLKWYQKKKEASPKAKETTPLSFVTKIELKKRGNLSPQTNEVAVSTDEF